MSIQQQRAGRVAFGLALVLGAAVMWTLSLCALRGRVVVPCAAIVLATWGLAFAAYRIAAGRARGMEGVHDETSDRTRTLSLVLPALGVALLLPLTIHMPFALAVGGVRSFDEWCGWSLIFAGIAHVFFAGLLVGRVRAIACGNRPRSVAQIFIICVIAGAVPGIAIPPIIVALTGIPMLGIVFPAFDAIAAAERRATPELPRAIVRAA